MKKDKKVYSRLLSWLLVFTMVLSMIPLNTVTVQATEVEESKQVVSSNAVFKENVKDLASDTYTAGSVLTEGYYYLSESKAFINTASKGSGLVIASNATVYIYIPKDVTLTAKGANANGTVGAGIYVPSGATLILVGEGTVTATGGNAANGSSGSNGSSSSKDESSDKFTAGKGGNGGNGGGGAGAGIGTPGGNGGSGSGSGGSSYSVDKDSGHDGYAGSSGQNGANAPAMGNVYAVSTMTITATGGQAGTASRTGGSSGSSSSKDNWDDVDRKIAGGAGGGAGGGGFSAYGIGTGGGGGGQGGGGASPGYIWTYATIGGGGGGAGAGAGTASGGLYSYTGWFSDDRGGGVSRSSTSGNSVTNSTTGGAGGQGGYGYAKPNKGSATYATGGGGGKGGNAGAVSSAYNNNTATVYETKPYTIHFNANGTDVSTQAYAYGQSVSVTMPTYDTTDVFLGWEVTTAGISSITEKTAFTLEDTILYQPGDVVTLDPGFTGDVILTAKIVDISTYNRVDSDVVSINTVDEFKEDVHNQEYTFTTKLNGVLADMGTMELRNEYTGISNGKKVSGDKNGKYTYTADSRGNTSYNIYYNNALAAGTSWIHTLENVNRSPVIEFYSTSVKIKVKGATSVKNVSLKAQRNSKVYTLNLRNTDENGFLEYYIETVENTHDKYDLYVNDICLVKGIKLEKEHNYVVYLLGTTVTLLKDNQPYLSTDGANVPKVDRDATTAGNFDGVALIPFSERSDAEKPNGMQESWKDSTYIFEEAYLGSEPSDLKGVLQIGDDFWVADAPTTETTTTEGIRGGYYKPGTNSSLVDAKVSLDGKHYIVDYYTVSYTSSQDTSALPSSEVHMKDYEMSLPAKVTPTDRNYFFYRWLEYVDTNGDGVQDKGWNPDDPTSTKVDFAYLALDQIDDKTALGTNKYTVIGKTEFVADCLAKDVTIAVADDHKVDANGNPILPDAEGHYVIDLGYVYESYPNSKWVLPNGIGNEPNAELFGSDWIQNNGTVDAQIEYITHTNTEEFGTPVYQELDANNNVKDIINPYNYADNLSEIGQRYFALNIAPKANLAVGEYKDTITIASKVLGASTYLEANKLTFKVVFEVKKDEIAPSITITLPEGGVAEEIGDTEKYVYYYDKTDVPTIEISANDDDVANSNAERGCVHDGTDVAYIKYYVHKLTSDEETPKTTAELETLADTAWTAYDANNQPQLTEEGTYYVYVKAADNAQTPNISYATSDKVIVDKTTPVIGIDKTEYCIGQEFTFTVLDKYFDKVEYISDEELEEREESPVTITTEKAEAADTYTVTVNTKSKAVGTIKLSVKDKAGNTNSIEVTIHGEHVKKLEKVHEVSRFFHGRMYYVCTVCNKKWEDFDVRIEPTGIANIKPYNYFEYYAAYEDGRRYLDEENEYLIEKYDFDKDGDEDDDDIEKIKENIWAVIEDAEDNAELIGIVQMFLQDVRDTAQDPEQGLWTSKYVPNEEQDVLLEELLENYDDNGIGLRGVLEEYSDYLYPTEEDLEADWSKNSEGMDVDFEEVQSVFQFTLEDANEFLASLEERAEKVAKIKAELKKFDDAIANSEIPTLETVKATDKELLEELQTVGNELLNTYSNELTDEKIAELNAILANIADLLARIDAVEALIVEIETENATLPALKDVTSAELNTIVELGQKLVENFFEEFGGVAPAYKQNITDDQHDRLVAVLGYDPDEDDSEMNPEELDGLIGKLIRIEMIAEEMTNIFGIATDFTDSEIVTIDDVPYMEELIARIDVLLETNNLTADERTELEALKEALKYGLTVIDDLTKDFQAIEDGVANLPADDVITSDSASVIIGLKQKIEAIARKYSGDEEGIMNFTEEQKDRIIELYSEILPAKQAKILEVQEALESVYAYAEPILEVENITSDYLDELEVLLGTETEIGVIDMMLAIDDTEVDGVLPNDFGDNLTAAEREALETLRAKLQAKQYLLKPVEERIQELIDKLEDLPEVDLVKSSDEAFVNEVKGLVDELLKNYSKNLTDDEIAELNALNDEIALRSERINDVRDAYNALETEVNKIPDVEKVTKENLEKIEQLLLDIEDFVEQYYEHEDTKDNFTDVEKENIIEWMETLSDKAEIIAEVQDEFETIKEAIEAIPNNETVKATDKDAITVLKEYTNALLTNNAGNLTADETVELNKIVEALDEKLAIIDTVANAIQDITDKANALPENVTSDNKATIDEYVKAVETIESTYANNMTDEQEDALDAVKADLTAQQELLEALSNRLAQLEKEVDAVPAIEKVTMNDKANIEALLDEIADINNVSANNLTDAEKTALADMEAELRNKLRQITDLDAKVQELANKVALMEEKDVTSDDTYDIAQLAEEIQDVMSNNSGNLTPVQQSDLMGMKVTLSMKQAEIDEVAKAIETIAKANEKISPVETVTSDDAKAIDKLIDRIEDTLLDYENNLTGAEKAALANLKDSLVQNEKAKIAEVADRIEEIEDLADAIPDADEITNTDAEAIDALEAIIDETLNTYANNLTDAEKDALNALRQELIQKEVVIEDTNDLLAEIRRQANAISPVESVTGDEEGAISDLTALVEATLDEHSDKLTKDEKSELKAIVKDLEQKQRRIDDVEELVTEIEEDFANIPETSEVTSDDASAIEKLIAKIDETVANYGNNLTDIQEDTLEAIKNELIKKQAKIEEVADVISDIEEAADAIPSIDELTSEDSLAIKEVEEAIDDALNTYADNLTEKEKQALENLKKELAEKETAIKATEDLLAEIKLAAKQIPQLSKVTSANETAIADLMEKVENTFDTHDKKLTDAQKEELAQIQNGLADKMEVVKTVEDILEGIREDANEIPNIAEVTGDDANAILILENAIDETLNTYANEATENLTEAEVNELENIKADLQVKKAMIKTVAEEVDELVAEAGQIPSVDKVTSEDANAIDHVEARIDEIFENYGNNLTEEQKSILEELKAELTEKEVAIKNTADLLAEIREEAEAIPEINVVTSENEAEIDALLEKIARTSETDKDALTEAEKAELANIKKAVEEKKALIVNVENAIATIKVTADELIPAIENVTSEDEMAIDALVAEIDTMLNEYANNLTISQTATLEAIKEELLAKKALIAEVADEIEEIEEAVAEIPSIEEVTSDDKEAIDSLIEAIDNVQNDYANNLTEAEANALTAMKNELLEKVVAIQETADLLAEIRKEAKAIPEESKVTSANATAIDNLLVKIDNTRDIHDEKLTRAEKSELKDLEKVLESKKEKIQEVIDALEDINEDAEAIPSVDEVTSSNTKAIEALKANVNEILTTYANNMTDVEKAGLKEIKNVLAEKEVAIQGTADLLAEIRKAAKEIPAVDKVTSNNETAVDVLLEKVDATGEVHKDKLTDAEKAELATIKSALEAKKAVIVKVTDAIARIEKAEQTLPTVETVTSANAETIKALAETIETTLASCANNVTDVEKAKLEAIKNALAEREAKIAEVAEVISTLKAEADAIPSVDKVTSAEAEAIKALNAKVDEAIATYGKNMTDAEEAELEAIKKALAEKEVVIKDTAELLAEIRKEAEAIPAVDKVTSADRVVVETLLEKVDATIEHHQDKLTDAEKAELEDIKKDLETKKNRIDEIKQVIEKLEEEAAKVPEMDELSSANSEHIEKVLDAIKAVLNNYSGNMTDEEITELNARMDILTEKLVYISQLPQYKPSEGDLENTTDSSKNAYNASLDNTDKELASKIPFTPVEKELIALGDEVDIYLEVKDISATVSATDKALVAGKLENTTDTLGMYIDVNLYKQVGDNLPQRISETNGLIKITFKVPESLLNDNSAIKRTYKIVRVHEGVAEFIDAEFNAEDKTLSFETDRFSTYALIYNDTKVADKSPVTGITDMTMYVLVLLAGIGIYCYGSKKKYFA